MMEGGSDGQGVMEGGDSGGGGREGVVVLGLSFSFQGGWGGRSHLWALVFVHSGGCRVLGTHH